MADHQLHLTGNPVADALLSTDPNALLIGMTLDQQVTMEKAFAGPAVIAERMGGRLDVAAIAAMDLEEFKTICSTPPAVHRFPGSMAERIQQVCQVLVEQYDGAAENLWAGVDTGKELKKRLQALPGFGVAKSTIFLALLGKRYGVQPAGWREAAAPYGEEGSHVSVADIVDEDSLILVRAAKKAAKVAAKAAKS